MIPFPIQVQYDRQEPPPRAPETTGTFAPLRADRTASRFDGVALQFPALDFLAARFGPVGFPRASLIPCYGMAEATLAITMSPAGRGPISTTRRPINRRASRR